MKLLFTFALTLFAAHASQAACTSGTSTVLGGPQIVTLLSSTDGSKDCEAEKIFKTLAATPGVKTTQHDMGEAQFIDPVTRKFAGKRQKTVTALATKTAQCTRTEIRTLMLPEDSTQTVTYDCWLFVNLN